MGKARPALAHLVAQECGASPVLQPRGLRLGAAMRSPRRESFAAEIARSQGGGSTRRPERCPTLGTSRKMRPAPSAPAWSGEPRGRSPVLFSGTERSLRDDGPRMRAGLVRPLAAPSLAHSEHVGLVLLNTASARQRSRLWHAIIPVYAVLRGSARACGVISGRGPDGTSAAPSGPPAAPLRELRQGSCFPPFLRPCKTAEKASAPCRWNRTTSGSSSTAPCRPKAWPDWFRPPSMARPRPSRLPPITFQAA